MGHALERTSPKGQSFVGTCTKCGKEGLTLKQVHQECANTNNLTQEQVIMKAIKP